MKLTAILSTFLIFVLKVEYSPQKLEVRVENYCLFQTSHLPVRLQSPALGWLANCCAPKSLRKMFGIEIQHRNRASTNQGFRTSVPEIARGIPSARARARDKRFAVWEKSGCCSYGTLPTVCRTFGVDILVGGYRYRVIGQQVAEPEVTW